MNLKEVRLLAVELMGKHELIQRGWSFQFDNSKRRLGVCNYRKKVIGMSSYLIPYTKIDKIKDTLLHEIAHALVGHGHGHSKVWKEKAIEIGCSGKRCYNPMEDLIKHEELNSNAKYKLVCDSCGTITPRHRKPKRKTSCGKCDSRYNDKYLLKLVQNF